MSLQDWYEKAQRLNTMGSRVCPRRIPCSSRQDIAFYEYVTNAMGQAIVLRCLDCGAMKHIEMSIGGVGLFEPTWTLGNLLPIPDRVVHLSGEPGSRARKQAAKKRNR